MPSYPGGVGLTIGIPSDAKPSCLEWSFGLMNLHPPTNFDIRWAMVKGKPVDEARTQIAEAALREKAKYLFFLGTDVTVPPYAIRQLIFHMEHHPKYAIAGGIYVHKSPPQEPLVYRGNGQGPYWDWKIGEVFDVDGIGMDATLIRTSVFNQIPQPWFKTRDDVEAYKDNIPKAEHWTEDLYFCRKVVKTCSVCGVHEDNHAKHDPQDKDSHEFSGWGIMADGGLLCQHWDNQRGIPYGLPMNSKPYRHLQKKGPKKIVDLGCGPLDDSYRTNEGEVTRVDIREAVNPDYRCDIRNTPFANEYFDVVFSSHTLEHFDRREVFTVMDEMCRILKKDGELRLVVPNLSWAAQHIMNNEVDTDVVNVLYGAQTYEENYHKMGFTQKMLEQLLAQRGFQNFQWDFADYHMMVRTSRDPKFVMPVMNPTVTFKDAETKQDGIIDASKLVDVELKKDDAGSLAEFTGRENSGTQVVVNDPQPKEENVNSEQIVKELVEGV